MDILTHTISGLAIGTLVASFQHEKLIKKVGIILWSGFGGAIPDLDAISLWTGFDKTIGKFFKLTHTGKEIYSEKFWYSHHAVMHSIFAGFIIAISIGIILYVMERLFFGSRSYRFSKFLDANILKVTGFFMGFLMHLIGDMPTPSSNWGGIRFFFPSTSYLGGSGEIWWWNNYDIFLIVSSVFALNLFLIIVRNYKIFNLRVVTVLILITGFTWVFWQIKTREFNFAYSGHSNKFQFYETKSKELQKNILGENLYKLMEIFDNKIKVSF